MWKRVSKYLASGVALLAMAGPAGAADLWGPRYEGSIKDNPGYAYRWTGFYIGGHAGLAVGDASGGIPGVPLTNTDVDLNGALYGGQVGYNYQMGNTVVGIEGTFSGTTLDGSSTCVLILNCKSQADWTATVVGRLGYAMDRTLVYAIGGVAWADLNTDVGIGGVNLASGGETHTGWVAGLGIEYAISDRISAKFEYNHLDFGSETHQLAGVIPVDVDAEIDVIKLGVNFKLF